MTLANVVLEQAITDQPIPNNQDIPKNEMDVFYRDESFFLPEGKTWNDLTDKEKKEAKDKYRFDVLRPGCYQGITACGRMGDNI